MFFNFRLRYLEHFNKIKHLIKIKNTSFYFYFYYNMVIYNTMTTPMPATTHTNEAPSGDIMSGGRQHQVLVGSRAQVWHGTAHKTSGGLTKKHLLMNKNGRIVSKAKHNTAKKEKRLEKAGYFAQKGKFGAVRKTLAKKKRSSKSKKSRK